MLSADEGTLVGLADVVGREVRDTDPLGHNGKGALAVLLIDADYEHSTRVVDRLVGADRQPRVPHAAAHRHRCSLLPDACGGCRVAAATGDGAADRQLARRPGGARGAELKPCLHDSSFSSRSAIALRPCRARLPGRPDLQPGTPHPPRGGTSRPGTPRQDTLTQRALHQPPAAASGRRASPQRRQLPRCPPTTGSPSATSCASRSTRMRSCRSRCRCARTARSRCRSSATSRPRA